MTFAIYIAIPWQLLYFLIIVTLVQSSLLVQASPLVNTALRASFDAAPYLLELLYVTTFT